MDINFNKPAGQITDTIRMSPKRTSMFELVILLVIGGLFFWFIVQPKAANLAEQKNLSESLAQESDGLSQQQAKIDSLIRQLAASSKDLSQLDESLPLHSRTTWVYLLVESVVESSGMTVGSLSVSNTEEEFVAADSTLAGNPFSAGRKVKKISANLGVTGSFAQFQALLKKMESSSRIIDIKTLDVSPASDGLLDFRISFDTYYFGVSSAN